MDDGKDDIDIVISDSGERGQVYATLEDYDGAPDAVGPTSFIGVGPTEDEAEQDLRDQLDTYAEENEADRGDYLYQKRKEEDNER